MYHQTCDSQETEKGKKTCRSTQYKTKKNKPAPGASFSDNILNKNYTFPLSESPPPLSPPLLPLCLRQRSGRCHVFLKQRRWAALHLLSHFLGSCLYFHLFILFCVSLRIMRFLCQRCPLLPHTRTGYYRVTMHVCLNECCY